MKARTLLEATSRLPDEAKARHADVPWHQLTGMRNVLVHDYLGQLDSGTVLDVVEHRLGAVEAAVRDMLEDADSR